MITTWIRMATPQRPSNEASNTNEYVHASYDLIPKRPIYTDCPFQPIFSTSILNGHPRFLLRNRPLNLPHNVRLTTLTIILTLFPSRDFTMSVRQPMSPPIYPIHLYILRRSLACVCPSTTPRAH